MPPPAPTPKPTVKPTPKPPRKTAATMTPAAVVKSVVQRIGYYQPEYHDY